MKNQVKLCSNKAVIGLGFGDEGKGLVTNALSHQTENATVVRYSGGQQAGHTVHVADTGKSHIFSNFGSGTLAHLPTYWSKFCTIDPVGIVKEMDLLKANFGIMPQLMLDCNAPITTPHEKQENMACTVTKKDGTCGVGVGATIQREADFHSIVAKDLEYPKVLEMKLDLLKSKYYVLDENLDMSEFFTAVDRLHSSPNIHIVDRPPINTQLIFEGSQGLLLDQNIGFFPHVTRSNTGTKNILTMSSLPDLFLVTRAYQTRHGNGPMTNEDIPLNVEDNPLETNQLNEFQGKFRKSVLDLSLLKYGMERDGNIMHTFYKTLVITCCDQVAGAFQYTINGMLHETSCKEKFGQAVADYLDVRDFILVDYPATLF